MKTRVAQRDGLLDFEALGRTLRLLDGDVVRLGMAYVAWPPAPDADPEGTEAVILGGTVGRLRVPVSEDDLPAGRGEVPPEAVQPGELAYLLIVGDEAAGAETMLAISSAHFVGAAYEEGVLKVQTGPLLITITANREGASHA